MNSFNHYAYGAVGEWMYRVLGGINIDEEGPGYQRVRIAPQPGGGFTFVRVKHEGPYGPIGCAWRLDKQQFSLTVDIPSNCTASVCLPRAQLDTLTESGVLLMQACGIERVNEDQHGVTVTIGSGSYTFVYPDALALG